MAKQSKTQLATVDESDNALALAFGGDDYSALLGGDDYDDGLGQTEKGDIRLPLRTLNSRGDLANGRKASHDLWYDTVTGEAHEEIEAILVARHRGAAYGYWDNGLNKTIRVCVSRDRVTGFRLDEDGHEIGVRECASCPDNKWEDVDGKPRKNCAEVWTFLALDPATEEPFLLKFRKTSMPAIKQHLQRHHIGKLRTVNPKAPPGANLPPYAYVVKLRGEMDQGGNFAKPVIELVGPAAPEQIRGIMAQHDALRDLLDRKGDEHAEAGDDASEQPAPTTAGDYVDAPASGEPEQQGFVVD